MDPAALDGGAGRDRADGLTQAQVGVGDDQLHPGQSTGLQAAQERGPERAILAVTDGEPEDLASTVAAYPGGHHHRLGDDPAVHPGLAVGGVHEEVREGLAGQGAIPEGRYLTVKVGADPAHLGLADPAVSTKRPDQVVDLAGADAVQIGLHHHREQRLIDPATPLQQRGKHDPARSLGIRSSKSPAEVVSSRERWPLRWPTRPSVRWCGAAPITLVSSASIKAW